MNRSRVSVYVSIAVILGVTILSGPTVGILDLTSPRIDGTHIGQGNATVDSLEAPTTARIDRGLQSQSYKLNVPDARIHIADITGQPVVSYQVSIRSLQYSRSTTTFLSASTTGWVGLSLSQDTFTKDRITDSRYTGTLTITLRYNTTERVLYNETVTLEVTE